MNNEDVFEDAGLTVERVKKDKLILKDDDVRDGIDYTHFNFLIMSNQEKFDECLEDPSKSAFDALLLLWTEFYPYLEAELKDKEDLFKKKQEVDEDADTTVQIGMEFKFKLDHAEAIIRNSGKMMWRSYQTRLNRASKQLEAEIERQKTDGTIS